MNIEKIKTKCGVITKTDNKLFINYKDGNIEGFIKNSIDESIIQNIRYSAELFILIGLGITYFNTDITIIDGVSMEPTYCNHKIIIKSAKSKYIDKIMLSRNCVVKFRSPTGETSIKRIVGMPGDIIDFDTFTIKINNKIVTTYNLEPHPTGGNKTIKKNPSNKIRKGLYKEITTIKLKENEYYVLGDNKHNSVDSKQYGPINFNSIISIIDK